MTFHVSNPNCNPSTGKKRHSSEAKKIQKYYDKKIKKSRENNSKKIDEKPKKEFTSSFNSFMTNFTASKEKMPANYESWKRVQPTGTVEVLDPKTGKTEREITWTKPKTLPRKSVSSGITKPKNKREKIIQIEREMISSYQNKYFNHMSGKWESKPKDSETHRNLKKYPDMCFAKQDGKCPNSACKGEYPDQYGCIHGYDRNTGDFWIISGTKEKLEAK